MAKEIKYGADARKALEAGVILSKGVNEFGSIKMPFFF